MTSTEVYLTPVQSFLKYEAEKPKEIFLRQPIDGKWKEISWQDAGREARKMASALQNMGLEPGSHIALLSKNCAHWIIADLAIMMSGHVSVPVYPNLTAKSLNEILEHSDSKVIFVGKLDGWETMRPGVPSEMRKIQFPMFENKGLEKWEDLLDANEELEVGDGPALDDVATIIYTSGTTGQPKGVMHKYLAFSFAATEAFQLLNIEIEKRFFSYLPMCHVAERMLVEMGALYGGGVVSFAESLDTFAANLQDAQPTLFLGVPRIWTKFQEKILENLSQSKINGLLRLPLISGMLKTRIKKSLGLKSAKFCFSGAAPLPQSTKDWFAKLDVEILEAYSMTENSAYSHLTLPGEGRAGTVGRSMPKNDVVISDIGEILVDSPAVMMGYYKMPEKTAEVFSEDGYLRTGDKGEIDSDGYLKITGRVKDIFKTSKGKYVVPNPIELRLSENENISQVCIVGVGIPQPIALVVLSESAVKAEKELVSDSIRDSILEINSSLDKHEKITNAVIVKEEWTPENEFLTPTLKIKRQKLDDHFGDRYSRWYGGEDVVYWES